MEVVNKILSGESAGDGDQSKSTKVDKELEVEIDEGTLLVSDYNSLQLKSEPEPRLRTATRDNVQLLVNKIWSLPTKCVEEVIVAELPKPVYLLPRSRKLPKPKPLTKWQQFAKEKGIRSVKKGRSKLKWDELLGKWVPSFGFQRRQADQQKEWLVEFDDNVKLDKNGQLNDPDPFTVAKDDKDNKRAKNELQRLRNIAKAKKIHIPKVGLPTNEHFKDANQLKVGAKVAEVSTASLGRFNNEVNKKESIKKVKAGKVTKKKKKSGQLKESASKTSKKPKGGKGNRDFRKKVGGRKRRK